MSTPLDYESLSSPALYHIRRRASIAVLISGIVTVAAGCGLGIIFASIIALEWKGHARAAHAIRFPWDVALLGAFITLVPLALGITSIRCSFRINRGSRTAAVAALIVIRIKFFFQGPVAFLFVLMAGSAVLGRWSPATPILALLFSCTALLLLIPERALNQLLSKTHPPVEPPE